jgi:hypothetical protein
MLVRTAFTLPSPRANWHTPVCQLPNRRAYQASPRVLGVTSVGPFASGSSGPATRPEYVVHTPL